MNVRYECGIRHFNSKQSKPPLFNGYIRLSKGRGHFFMTPYMPFFLAYTLIDPLSVTCFVNVLL